MEFIKVESSNIQGIYYDESSMELFIKFNKGDIYKYTEVPISLYQMMLTAESIGKFFSENIRNIFHYEKVF